MKTAHAIAWPPAADPPQSFRSQLAVRSRARLRTECRSAVIYPCREQVIEALSPLLTIAGRLRSAGPVDPRGVARLNILLSDGSGPCYVRIRRNALTDALQEISQWLAVPQ